MSILNILSNEIIERTLKKFTILTEGIIWLTDAEGNVIEGINFNIPKEFELGEINRKLFSPCEDKEFCLPDTFQILLRKSANIEINDKYDPMNWLIGLVCEEGPLVWSFPLTYFNETLGFIALTGINLVDINQFNNNENTRNELKIKNSTPLSQNSEQTSFATLPSNQVNQWLKAFALIGEEMVENIHLKKLESVRAKVTEIIKNAYNDYPIIPPRVVIAENPNTDVTYANIFGRSKQWVDSVYRKLCNHISEQLKVGHFAILITRSENSSLIVIGASHEEKINQNQQYDLTQCSKNNGLSPKFFHEYQQATHNKDGSLIIKEVNVIPDTEGGEQHLRDIFDPYRGLWAPMLIQGRHVGLLRILIDRSSLPLVPFHKYLFASFANELNEHLDMVVSHYREAVLAEFPPAFSNIDCYSSTFFQRHNPFELVAKGVTRLLNCRAAVIRILNPKTGRLDAIGWNKVFEGNISSEDKDNFLEQAVISRTVVNTRKPIRLNNLYDYDVLKNAIIDQVGEDCFLEIKDKLKARINFFKNLNLKSMHSEPVLNEQGEVIGLLNVFQSEYITFTEHDRNGLRELAVYLSSFIQVKSLHDNIRQQKVVATKARQFYEELSIYFNQTKDISVLFKIIETDINTRDYFDNVEVYQCDRIENLPFMEQIYKANTARVNQNPEDYQKQINILIKQLKAMWSMIDAEYEENPDDAEINDAHNEIYQWMVNALNRKQNQRDDDFFDHLTAQLTDEEIIKNKGPQDLLFPKLNERYYRVKYLIHNAYKQSGHSAYKYCFYHRTNQDKHFSLGDKSIRNYIEKQQDNNDATLQSLDMKSMKMDPPITFNDEDIFIPILSYSKKNIYGLCHFTTKKVPDSTLDLEQSITAIINNLQYFIAQLLSSNMERIWSRKRTIIKTDIAKLFDINKEPAQFFRQVADFIKIQFDAEASILLGTQSLLRDALIPLGYSGFKTRLSTESREINEYLESYTHREKNTSTHMAFVGERPIIRHDIRYDHFCRITYIRKLEENLNNKGTKLAGYCAVPVLSCGKAIGLIEVYNKKQKGGQSSFSKQDFKLLEALAEILGQELANYELIREADGQIGAIAHSNRAPLHAIRGYAYNMQKYLEEVDQDCLNRSPFAQKLLNTPQAIESAVNRAKIFINTTLEESRSKHIKMETTEEEEMNFADIICEYKELFSFDIADENISLIYDTDELASLEFKYGKNHIELLIANLFENALKYSDKNETITIWGTNYRLEETESGTIKNTGYVQFNISNIGNIAYKNEEERENLFRSFYRGRSVGNKKGAGIGLPLCKRVVDHFFGDITITTKQVKNSGKYKTTVTFSLFKKGRILSN